MIETIITTFKLDDFTVIQIVMLTALCGFIVSQNLEGWMGPAFCYAGLAVAATGTNIVLRAYGVRFTNAKDLDTILMTALGLTGGVIVVFTVILTMSAMNNRVGESAQAMRERAAKAERDDLNARALRM